jgi:hypothetical protein
MARRSALFWAVTLVALLGTAIYVPAWIARSATAADEPVNFLTRPELGWRFMIDAVREVPGAKAGSPSAAREDALRLLEAEGVQPTRVDLLYLPDRRLTIRTGKGSRVVTTNATLVWRVTGRTKAAGPLRTLGLVDLESGRLIYDARHDTQLVR